MPYSQTLAATGGTAPYSWTATGDLPPGLALAGGVISGTPTAPGSFSFTVQASDAGAQTASRALTLAVRAALSITTASLADASAGTAYTQTLNATGGSPPYAWSIASGTPPDGLSLNGSTGVLSGTPRSPGSAAFTVQVRDSAGVQATRAYSIATAAGLTITAAPVLPQGAVGGAYEQPIAAAGGRTPYTWSVTAGAVPGGLSLNPSTGVLSGRPTASGQFEFTVRATDAGGAAATKAFTLSIAAGLIISTAPGLPDGVPGAPYAQPLSAAGGVPPYAWSITAGSLPPGLQLDPASGMIGGQSGGRGRVRVYRAGLRQPVGKRGEAVFHSDRGGAHDYQRRAAECGAGQSVFADRGGGAAARRPTGGPSRSGDCHRG